MGYLEYFFYVLIALITYLFVKALRVNRHWKQRGIPGPTPLPFFGNMLPMVMRQKSIGQLFREIHEAYPNEPVVGYFFYMQPGLLIRDPNLIDRCLITDFQHFTSRFGTPDIRKNPLNSSLILIKGNVWKALRGKFTPVFTIGKLRNMFPNISAIGDKFICGLREHVGKAVDASETFCYYVITVFASTGFGLEPSSVDKECEFTKRASEILPPDLATFLRFTIRMSHPSLTNVFNMNLSSNETTKYYTDVVKEALQHRRTTGAVRNDMVQQMLSIQQKGPIEIEQQYATDGEDPVALQPTDDLLAGQALGFFFAGFDTVHNVLSLLIHDIALHADHQEKLREEITRVKSNHNDQITYESLKDMEYLDAFFKESLRLHSNVPILWRLCTKTYTIPGVNCTLNPNNGIIVSSYGIHMDPKIYPEPTKFLPERWLGNNKTSTNTYIPWGYGPRICIGMQLATLELKYVLTKLLVSFDVKLHPSFDGPLQYNPRAFFNIAKQKVLVDLKPL